jgi:hypothetical protein
MGIIHVDINDIIVLGGSIESFDLWNMAQGNLLNASGSNNEVWKHSTSSRGVKYWVSSA